MLLFYATRDGQSRRIAAHIAARLAERGIDAPPQDLAGAFPRAADLAAAPLVVVVAAVRYGRHLPEAERLLATHRELLARTRFVFVSVNLTARKAGKDAAAGHRYLRKLLARHRLAPALAAAVAGRLDYPHYRWLDRQIIRLIMKMTGGPTDPRSCIEFTSWQSVDEIAARIAEVHASAGKPGMSGDFRPA
jgi:menaquinone-dependent protoporphyrinogen oxidase